MRQINLSSHASSIRARETQLGIQDIRSVPDSGFHRNNRILNLWKRFYFLFVIVLLAFITIGCSSSPNTDPSEPLWANKYLIGAYYYLWYPGNWREGYINGRLLPQQLPTLGQYDSSDLKTIEQHISWSSRYGIDFWAVSWWPDHPELDRIIREKIFKAKNINDIKFCIFYETSGLGLKDDRIDFTPDKTKKLISDFKFLAQHYFSHPSYLKFKGRPVAIIYLTRTFIGDYPEAINSLRKSLQELGFNPFLIGDEIFWYVMHPNHLPPSPHPESNRIKMFDGITAYNMYNWAKPQQMGYGSQSTFLSDVHKLYREYQKVIGDKGHLIPGTIPGYNDRGARLSENHPVIPRQFTSGAEEGSFFTEALKRTVLPFVDPDIHVALITSFNEWNEGTQIEPTAATSVTNQDHSPTKTEYTQGFVYQGYGERYLSILRDTFSAVGGRVMDEKGGNPLPKTNLKAYKGESLMAATLTDSQGFFNLSRLNLPPDIYEVRANLSGYQENKSKIQVIGDKAAILYLRLKKE
jgi:glycoprotein endo-alpha-1,2-mannosidase